MNPKLLKVETTDDYKLRLHYANGECKLYDCADILKKDWPICRQLKVKNYFKTAKIIGSGGGIEWPNGMDICPDTLYFGSENIAV